MKSRKNEYVGMTPTPRERRLHAWCMVATVAGATGCIVGLMEASRGWFGHGMLVAGIATALMMLATAIDDDYQEKYGERDESYTGDDFFEE